MLNGKTVLVTGAPGFIGCRLVEKLMLEQHANVRALVHKFSRAARLARLPVEMRAGRVADAEAIDNAVKGCDVVFNCAHDWMMPKENIQGTQILIDACLRHGVKRLVHLSTIATYQPLPDGDLDETRPAEPDGWVYKDTKIETEKLILKAVKEQKLPATILLPTIVYGPYARSWVDYPVKNLLTGTVILPDEGKGWCNAVYIDDVVDAMLLAAEREQAIGERFLISGSEEVTWKDFFESLQEPLGAKSLQYWSDDQIKQAKGDVMRNVKLMLSEPKRLVNMLPIRPLLEAVYQRMGDKAKQQALKLWRFKRETGIPELFLPDKEQLELYKARTHVSIDKAQRLLGYRPAYSFAQGMALTKDYIRWAYPADAR
jgi:nucleoside-diphosphate-sugar epimerase